MAKKSAAPSKPSETSSSALLKSVLAESGGIFRLAPTWVPRSFLMPGRRIKLHPQDIYAYGAHRGGIDERWFASTTPAANEEPPTGRRAAATSSTTASRRFTLREAVDAGRGDARSAPAIWKKYKRWPVYSKFFDNMGPIPHHMHQNDEQAAMVGQQGKPESYYFPPQLNAIGNNFPYTFFGLEPGTTKDDIRRCLERLEQGRQRHPQLSARRTASSRAPAGWCRRACCTRPARWSPTSRSGAPTCSACTSRWSRAAYVPWESAGQGHAQGEAPQDLDYLVEQLDWEGNVNPNFKDSHYLEPIPWPTPPRRATSIAGSSTARWTARSCSPRRN